MPEQFGSNQEQKINLNDSDERPKENLVPRSILSGLGENKEYGSSSSSDSESSEEKVQEKSESYCSREKQEDIL